MIKETFEVQIERLAKVEEVLAKAASGDHFSRIRVDASNPDEFTAIETGINLILSDLKEEASFSIQLAEELERLRKG